MNDCSPAYIRSVNLAGVHVHRVHQTVFLVYDTRLRGMRDWGHGFWVHRVDTFGRNEARGGTMSGGQNQGGTGGRETVPGWEYVEVLSWEGAKTHWQCVFYKTCLLISGGQVWGALSRSFMSLPCMFWLSQWTQVLERGISLPMALLWTRGGTCFL